MALIILYLFLFCLYIQLFYFLLVFSKLIFFEVNLYDKAKEYSVSIVIAAHNELKNLTKLIPLLESQNYHDYEIVIVNDRSDDGTRELLEKKSKESSKLKVVHIEQNKPGINPKKWALTKGIETAENEVILLTDADCFPLSKNWISYMCQGFKDGKEIVLGYCQYEKKPGFLNHLIRFETFYTGIQYLSFSIMGAPYMGVGRNLAYLKSLFINNDGFKNHMERTGGDDDLFIQKAGNKNNTSIAISPKSQTVSIPKRSYSEWFKQKKRHLYSGKKYKIHDMARIGLLNISHIFFYASFFVLLFSSQYTLLIIGLFVLRTGVLITIFTLVSNRLKDNNKWYLFPILEFVYIFNYILIGISALFARKIKWN